MSKRIDWSELKDQKGFYKLVDDLFMLVVVLLNLSWLVFDWLFGFGFFQQLLSSTVTDFYVFYRDQVHPNFLVYDAYFVAIFIAELLIRWAIAVRQKVYRRWWLYPVAHWYDVIGCFPLGAFRWLRVFRAVSMLMRLHKMGFIDLRKTFIFEESLFLFKEFTNTVTDRVLINLVSGLQRGVSQTKEVEKSDSTISEAVKPDQHQLAKVVTQRIQKAARDNYEEHRETLREQIETIVRDGFDNSAEMKKIEALPLVGKQITESLENTLGDIAYHLVDSLFNQAISEESGQLMEDSINTTLDAIFSETDDPLDQEEEELNRIIRKILGRVLERVKDDIRRDSIFLREGSEEVANRSAA